MNTNFSLAKWAAHTGNPLIATRENDMARYELKIMYPNELVFVVRKDGEYHRTLKLRTYGTLAERELMLPHVRMDKDWFNELTLEITLLDAITA